MEYHRLLKRQIRKFLNGVEWEENQQLVDFMNNINDAYINHDRDQKLNQKAFDIAGREYEEINSKLNREKEVSQKAYKSLLSLLSDDIVNEYGQNLEEEDLLEITNLVEAEIIRRNQIEVKLQEAIALAEKASQAKSEFLSTMSHEIRSPLNVIIGLTHLLIEEEPVEHQMEYLEALEINAANLKLIINDILDFSKIEAGKLELAPSSNSLKNHLNQIKFANSFSAKENENEIILDYDSELEEYYIFDKVRLGQVITNMVSNAVKFTKKGSITIKTECLEDFEDKTRLKISIIDTGIGISKESQKTIFDDFKQASKFSNRSHGGTGLGLAISKKLLHLMDAEIQLESEPNKGSNFYFEIEFPKAKREDTLDDKDFQIIKNEGESRIFDILVVEDAKFNYLVIFNLLKNLNLKIDHAVNGVEAVKFAQNKKYDLILMDIQMPIMDGIEATKIIRNTDMETQIVALTASSTKNAKELVEEVGMNDFISKPIDPIPFKRKIVDLLR